MIKIREALGKLESLIHLLEITPLGERRDGVWKAALEAIEEATENIKRKMGPPASRIW